MELRRDLLLGFGSLAGLNLLVAIVTIVLFSRMGPVIERILKDNVFSTQAGEEMLEVLAATSGGPAAAQQRERFLQALRRAQSNVTDQREQAPLARMAALGDRALAGEPAARLDMLGEIRTLTSINYQAMRALDTEAQRLGLAGAWFAVFLAVVALALSVLTIRRLSNRLLIPVHELWATLEANRSGDIYRRCAVSDPPLELGRIVTRVNEILDLQTRPRPWSDRRAQADHAVVLWTLRRHADPVFIVDERGQIFATNGPAHALLGQSIGAQVRDALAGAGKAGRPSAPAGMDMTFEHVPEGQVWVCTVKPA